VANRAGIFITGLVVGALAMGIFVYMALPRAMLTVHGSALDFDSTVVSLENAARQHDYSVPHVYDIQQSLISAGHVDMTRLKVISLCQPDYAYEILSRDPNKPLAALMPCRVAVYEAADGRVYISAFNMGRLAGLLGGNAAEVMSRVAADEDRMFSHLYTR
jgi:uncharacterized protein (DUF302 family)